jgi:putative Holliday junction resolvase
MRIMGVDYGFRRIGIAFGETDPHVVTPRASIAATGTLARDADALSKLATADEARTVVLGLPVEEDGQEGKMARIARRLGALIEQHGLQVAYSDERYTSLEAEKLLREGDLTAAGRRKQKDSLAACLLLERFLAEVAE